MTEQSAPPDVPDYECLRCIGSGAYGDVWIAKSVSGAYRAVKVVRRDRFQDDRPFEREFEAVQKYEGVSRQHPALIDILHVGRRHDEFFYYAMYLADPLNARQKPPAESYLPRTLRGVMKERRKIPVKKAIEDVIHLLGGLAVLHKANLVHRDIKPGNVLYLDGFPVLADIGLVTAVEEDVSYVGTQGYMPPEGPGKPRADLYAMGMLLYVMISGRRPTDFPDIPTLADEEEQRLFAKLNRILLKACDVTPRRRYANARTLARSLRSCLQPKKPLRRRSESPRSLPEKRRTKKTTTEESRPKTEFKQGIINVIRQNVAELQKDLPEGAGQYLTEGGLHKITVQVSFEFETRFGSVPHEVAVACKLAEATLAQSLSQRLQLLKTAVGLGGGLGGISLVIGGIGAALGWGQGVIAAITAYFMGTSIAGPIGLIGGGLTLAGVAAYFGLRRHDPVAATDRALKALESGVMAAADAAWDRHAEEDSA